MRQWMRRALDLAREAEAAGEVPVGCVVVADGEDHRPGAQLADRPARSHRPRRDAGAAPGRVRRQQYRLTEATLYCTLEPCAMCAGALVAARIRTLVFGARDLRFGGVRSKFQIADSPLLESPGGNRRRRAGRGIDRHAAAVLQRAGAAKAYDALRQIFCQMALPMKNGPISCM